MTTPAPEPPPEATPIARIALELLGDDLLGLYLHGSAVSGQRSGRWPRSGPARPVELTVVVRDDIVPWRFPPRAEFVYGEWLRAEFERGDIPAATTDPDLAILLTAVRSASLTLAGPPARRILDPVPPDDLIRAIAQSLPTLTGSVAGDERNAVLTLARMWITAETGALVSKAGAAQRLAPRLPAAHAAVLRRARDGYLGIEADDWARHTEAVGSFVRHATAAITAACAAAARSRDR
ncbi:MAG: DUF4111 domain-containing protein [Nocardia sp.]|nr:DUF4111 domain-containing protein [Nocardia sp.]